MRGLACALALFASCAQAEAPMVDANSWLKRIQHAAQRLSYTGTFVFRQGERNETSRITRIIDESGDHEHLEVLDGQPREVIRHGEEVRCYLPERKVILVERRTGQRSFPALLPTHTAHLNELYSLSLGESARIAGFETQSVLLTPKDDLRYGYKLWADKSTGMLLKARILNERNETLEEFSFTHLRIGGEIRRELLLPRVAMRGTAWHVEQAVIKQTRLADAGWQIKASLPGFERIVEVKRQRRDAAPIGQVVFSDGMSAVSVFIEPTAGRQEALRSGLSTMGAMNSYTRELGDHVITVLGEVPIANVRRIGNAVEFSRQP